VSINNRQGGRRRGRNNQRSQGGQNRNVDQGNRIDSRARGNAAQLLEKYRNMARDAQLSGDRVMTEYYLQFADHYFRVLSDSRQRQEEQRSRYDDRDDDREPQQGFESDEGDSMDELDAIDSIGRAPRRQDRQRDRGGDRQRGERNTGERNSGERNGDAQEFRAARPAQSENARTTQGEGEGEEERRERRPRRERSNSGGNGRAAPADRDTSASDDAPLGIDIAVLPPAIGGGDEAPAAPAPTAEEAPAPKRRGRPRKVANDDENAAA
jgi:hypothetical protein